MFLVGICGYAVTQATEGIIYIFRQFMEF
jgi:hypothetical protein